MRVHGDQADLALVLRVAERFENACLRNGVAASGGEIESHQIAVLGVSFVALLDPPRAQLAPVDGFDRPAASAFAKDAEEAALVARQNLDRLGFVACAFDIGLLEPADARQHAVADAHLCYVLGRASQMREHEHGRTLAVIAVPRHRLGDEIAVRIASRNFEHGHGGQVAFLAQVLAVAGERAVPGHIREQPFRARCAPRP